MPDVKRNPLEDVSQLPYCIQRFTFYLSRSPNHRLLRPPLRTLFIGIGCSQERLFFEGTADQLQSDGKALPAESARYRYRRHAGKVRRNGENVRQIHLERV